MARKKYDDSTENHERWLISYADFITLLFALFVVMYAISIVHEGKYQVLSNALGTAFGGTQPVSQLPTTVEPTLPLTHIVTRKRIETIRREQERLTALARQLTATLEPLVKAGKVRVTQNSRGVRVEINASVLFDEGEAALTEEATEVLQSVAGLLKGQPHMIEVEGHTDTRPISSALFPSNWELSAVRASSVVRLFIENGVSESRLTAIGKGANLPIASNADEIGRARNRRVAVTILSAAG